jgi:hypothetical protein
VQRDDANGNEIGDRWDNTNGTVVDDFYNTSGTMIGQTVYNGDAILHSSSSNVRAENTAGMTMLDVTGTTLVTASELAGFTTEALQLKPRA